MLRNYILLIGIFCSTFCFSQTNVVEYYPKQNGLFKILKIKKQHNILIIYAKRVDSLVPLDTEQFPQGKKGDRIKIVSLIEGENKQGEKIKRNKIYNLTIQSLYVKRINDCYMLPPWSQLHVGVDYHGTPISLEPKRGIVNIFKAQQIRGRYYIPE